MKRFIKEKLREAIELPIEIGDTVLMGKFKNKKVVVKDIDWDEEKGDLKINGKPALKMRIQKKLEEANHPLGDNIRVGDIFPNDNTHKSGYNDKMREIGSYYKDDASFEQNPIEDVDINKIIPTQKFVSRQNLEDVKGTLHEPNTGAYLVNYKGLYYVIDGHHRISTKILYDQKTIKAFVYTI
jgi:hypothetical protein